MEALLSDGNDSEGVFFMSLGPHIFSAALLKVALLSERFVLIDVLMTLRSDSW